MYFNKTPILNIKGEPITMYEKGFENKHIKTKFSQTSSVNGLINNLKHETQYSKNFLCKTYTENSTYTRTDTQ